jgi:hypothetical protein
MHFYTVSFEEYNKKISLITAGHLLDQLIPDRGVFIIY